jgi:hypothetical protein
VALVACALPWLVGVLVAALGRVQLVLSGEYRGGSQGASRIKCVSAHIAQCIGAFVTATAVCCHWQHML